MQKKVTIIGAGAVGATTAFALLTRGAASEVVLIDVNTEQKAKRWTSSRPLPLLTTATFTQARMLMRLALTL